MASLESPTPMTGVSEGFAAQISNVFNNDVAYTRMVSPTDQERQRLGARSNGSGGSEDVGDGGGSDGGGEQEGSVRRPYPVAMDALRPFPSPTLSPSPPPHPIMPLHGSLDSDAVIGTPPLGPVTTFNAIPSSSLPSAMVDSMLDGVRQDSLPLYDSDGRPLENETIAVHIPHLSAVTDGRSLPPNYGVNSPSPRLPSPGGESGVTTDAGSSASPPSSPSPPADAGTPSRMSPQLLSKTPSWSSPVTNTATTTTSALATPLIRVTSEQTSYHDGYLVETADGPNSTPPGGGASSAIQDSPRSMTEGEVSVEELELAIRTFNAAIQFNSTQNRGLQAKAATMSRVKPTHFEMLRMLGRGDVGRVYLVRRKDSGELYAMKVLRKHDMLARNKVHRLLTEWEILVRTDHPFISTLYYSFQSKNKLYLVMEYCSGGELFRHLQHQPYQRLPEVAARFYAAEVLLALEYLHMRGYVYRDIKPENILIDHNGHIRLTDFDLSKASKDPEGPKLALPPGKRKGPRDVPTDVSTAPSRLDNFRSFVGTIEYLAPEIIRDAGHNAAVDWWGFGVLIYEMVYGSTPFKGTTQRETCNNIATKQLTFPAYPKVSRSCRDIIKRLLETDPEKRLGCVNGASDVRAHRWWKGVNFNLIRNETPPWIPPPAEPSSLTQPAMPPSKSDITLSDSEPEEERTGGAQYGKDSTTPYSHPAYNHPSYKNKKKDNPFSAFQYFAAAAQPAYSEPSSPPSTAISVSSICSSPSIISISPSTPRMPTLHVVPSACPNLLPPVSGSLCSAVASASMLERSTTSAPSTPYWNGLTSKSVPHLTLSGSGMILSGGGSLEDATAAGNQQNNLSSSSMLGIGSASPSLPASVSRVLLASFRRQRTHSVITTQYDEDSVAAVDVAKKRRSSSVGTRERRRSADDKLESERSGMAGRWQSFKSNAKSNMARPRSFLQKIFRAPSSILTSDSGDLQNEEPSSQSSPLPICQSTSQVEVIVGSSDTFAESMRTASGFLPLNLSNA